MPDQHTIGDWTPAELVKFLRDFLERDPPGFLDTVKVNNLEVVKSLKVADQASFTSVLNYSIGIAGAPGFQNSWANVGGSWAKAGYWRDATNIVHLTGAIVGGATGTVAFTLPPGFLPVGDESWTIPTSSGTATLTIATDGTVTISYGGTPTWFSLSTVLFLSKQS